MRISIACRLFFWLVLAGTSSLLLAAESPLLLREPTLSRTIIVFRYADDLWSVPRDGADFAQPQGAIFGPKVMIINEFAGSGGDAMPWYFKREGVGKLVGKRTWGGLVGLSGYPDLMDGGMVMAPSMAIWNPDNGQWDVENRGVAPDIEVELDPAQVRQGHDPQLEKAVQVIMEELAKNPPKQPKHPPYPNYHAK